MGLITLILSIIGFAIQYGPQIAALMKEIFDRLKHVKDPAKQSLFAKEASEGFEIFRSSGDKRPLIDLLRRLHDEN